MLKGSRSKATWNDDDVIRGQRLGNGIRSEAETSVIRDFLCKGADLPIELRYKVHRLETRERIINADQVQSCHPVENNECSFHLDTLIKQNIQVNSVSPIPEASNTWSGFTDRGFAVAGRHLPPSISAKTSLATRIASNAAGMPQ